MPIYSFVCDACERPEERFIAHTNYVAEQSAGFPAVTCPGCGSPRMSRDHLADMRTQLTERSMDFGDLAPAEVAGRGGYSRERSRMLKEAKLIEKGDLPKRRRRVSMRITESEIRARLAADKVSGRPAAD